MFGEVNPEVCVCFGKCVCERWEVGGSDVLLSNLWRILKAAVVVVQRKSKGGTHLNPMWSSEAQLLWVLLTWNWSRFFTLGCKSVVPFKSLWRPCGVTVNSTVMVGSSRAVEPWENLPWPLDLHSLPGRQHPNDAADAPCSQSLDTK